jgi:hypothetical protein
LLDRSDDGSVRDLFVPNTVERTLQSADVPVLVVKNVL